MQSAASTTAAARLAHRLDRAVLCARLEVLLRLVGIGCAAAAVAATVTAGLDCWLKPTGFWLGGSIVWAATVGSVVWSARRLARYHRGPGKTAGWWPTRLTTARHWERPLPPGGSPISAAVGFLMGFEGDGHGSSVKRRGEPMPSRRTFAPDPQSFTHSPETSLRHSGCAQFPAPLDWQGPAPRPLSSEKNHLTATGQPAATAASAADFVALAIQRADRAASELPREACPTAGLTMALIGLAAGVGLLLSARLGPADWQTAVRRQLPPAVGGWPPVTALPAHASQTLPALTPSEIPVATRRLIAGLAACAQVAQTPAFEATLQRVAVEAGQLAKRLPAAAAASIIHWAAEWLPGVATAAAQVDRVTKVRRMAETGTAAAQLAEAAAVQQQLADQLVRLVIRQPGLLPDELAPAAQQQLVALAAAQQSLDQTAAVAAAVLLDAGLLAQLPDRPAGLFELIGQNRLALATVAAGQAARGLAAAVAPLGLDIPETAGTAGGTLSDSLTRVVVRLTTVTRELDRESQELAAAQAVAAGELAAATLPAAAGDAGREQATARPSAGGLPGIAGGEAGSGDTTAAPASPGGPVAGLAAGPAWTLAAPERQAVGRVAVDHTLPPATAEAFNDYLVRLLPPPVASEVSSQ